MNKEFIKEAVNRFRSFYSRYDKGVLTARNIIITPTNYGVYISLNYRGVSYGQAYRNATIK